MVKTIWFYMIGALVLGTGGWYFYVAQQPAPIVVVTPPTPPAPPEPSKATDDELNKRRQEGIGSIRNLKPVPLPASPGGH